MAETAEKPLLTPAEEKQLEKLLAKANAGTHHGPAVRIGQAYIALTNLSVPRRVQNDPKDLQTDLVLRGETVYLTDEEAAKFLRYGEREGRRVAVIRLASEVDGNNIPRPHPQFLSGPVFRPQAPQADGTRPDPPGSTRVVEYSTPESAPPVPGAENTVPEQDAIDIPPRSAAQDAVAGADMDLVAAVKAQTGVASTPRDGRR